MSNPVNMAIGVVMLCCSSSCASSLMKSGLGGLFGDSGGLLGGILGAPGSLVTSILGVDSDAGGFEGGFAKGLEDPVGATGDLINVAKGNRGAGLKQVDPDSEAGKKFASFKEIRCNECRTQSWPADCTSKGFTLANCG
jgi:hypothetical protein